MGKYTRYKHSNSQHAENGAPVTMKQEREGKKIKRKIDKEGSDHPKRQ